MRKLHLTLAFVALMISTNAFAGWGIWKSLLQINGGTQYDIEPTSVVADFNQSYIGRYSNGGTLSLDWVEVCTWRDACCSNTCAPVFNYRVYRTCDTPPSFSTATMTFGGNSTFPCTGGNDQRWFESIGVNLLNGLTTSGTYVVEVFVVVGGNSSGTSGCGETQYHSNGGLNYIAYFEFENTDSFSDGNFTATPVWNGSTSAFTVVNNSDVGGLLGTENVRTSTLRVNASAASDQYLYRQFSTWNAQQEWYFWVGRRGVAASAADRTRIWLYSNNLNLNATSSIDGYYLEIGDDSGDDEIRFYRSNNGVSTLLFSTSSAVLNGLTDYGITFAITRSETGVWTIKTSALPTSTIQAAASPTARSCPETLSTVTHGTVTDTNVSLNAGGFFGIAVKNSAGSGQTNIEFDNLRFRPLAANTYFNFNATTGTQSEPTNGAGDLSFTIGVNIFNADAAVGSSVQVNLTSGNGARLGGATTATLSWSPAETGLKNATFTIDDNAICDDIQTLVFTLQSATGGLNAYAASPTTFTLTVLDNDMGYATLVDDNFEDGNSTGWTGYGNGSWSANNTGALTGTYSIRHSNTGANGISHVATSANNASMAGVNTTWRFNMNFFNLDPSGGNKWQVYLAANNTDFFGTTTNGYALGVDPTLTVPSDTLCLWRVTNGVYTRIITTDIDWGTTNAKTGFEIIRDENGLWTLYMDSDGDFNNLVSKGSVTDATYSDLNYFGAKFTYTSSNSDKLSLDDVSVTQKGCRSIYYSQTPGGNFNGAIWAPTTVGTPQSISPGRFTRLVVQSGAPVTLTANAVCDDIEIQAGAVLDLSNYTFEVYGNWIHSGTVNVGNSTVVLKGNEAQSILGTGGPAFYKLNIDNSFGTVQMLATTTVRNQVNLLKGTLQTNGNLILKSEASTSGSIGPIQSGADISGNVTIERYLPPSVNGYTYLGSTVAGLTLADWNDDLVTTGFPGSDFPSYSFNSVYWYDETQNGGRNVGWTAATNITNTININRGYTLYQNGAAWTVDVTGQVQKGAIAVPLSFTNNSNSADGWNLVANIYPSEVDWVALEANSADVNTYYVYDATLPGYRTYAANTQVGSASRYIPHSQGFLVKATAGGQNLNYMESIKTNTNAAFERSEEDARFVRFNITRNGEGDEAILAFNDEATHNYESTFDAEKWESPVLTSPEFAFMSADDVQLTIDARPLPNTGYSMNMYMDLPQAGEYTITVSEIQNLPLGACIYLEDTQSQQVWTVSAGAEWVLTLNEAYTGSDRFVMHVGAFAQVNTTDPACANLSGTIEVAAEEGNWVMTVMNANEEILANEISGVFDSALGGEYTVEIRNTEAACEATPITVTIVAPAAASFAYVFENAACNESTGQIIYEMINGGEYQMQLLNGVGLIISEMTTTESYMELLDLAPDSYTLTLTNACTSFTESISLLDDNAVSAEIDAANTNVVFTEGTSGLISLTATVEGTAEMNWYVNGEMITTGSALNYEITEAGEYAVTLAASNEFCSAEDQVVVLASTVVSTEELTKELVTVVNRGNHALITFNGVSATASNIAIYNTMGQLIYTKTIGQSAGQVVDVDMQNWATGAYTVNVTNTQGEVLSKTLMK
ncbi:MAG: DUF3244 domain-containing protein [Flavobacteriales bacterium]